MKYYTKLLALAYLRKKGGEEMKIVALLAFVLTVVGALNWGLVGLLDFNLVNILLGSIPSLEKVVYVLVGLAGLYLASTYKNK